MVENHIIFWVVDQLKKLMKFKDFSWGQKKNGHSHKFLQSLENHRCSRSPFMDLLEKPGLIEACFGSFSHVCHTSLPVYIKMDKVNWHF